MGTADYYPKYQRGLQNQLYDILSSAAARGINVRVILDKSNWSKNITRTNRETKDYLTKRGVQVKFDSPSITTHAKVVVIDRDQILMGSSNWNYPTYTDSYQTNLLIKNRKVAASYAELFDLLWKSKSARIELRENFRKAERSIIPILNTPSSRHYFQIAKKVLSAADESIEIIMYRMGYYPSFKTSKSNILMNKLIQACKRGVRVRVILEKSDWSESTNRKNRRAAWWLKLHNIEVKFDRPSVQTHAKLIVLDEESLLLGSSNWTYYSLQKNIETDVLIQNSPKLADYFVQLFDKLWNRGTSR